MPAAIPSPTAVELRIASTWDGRPIPAAEEARLRLRLTPGELAIAVAAPFHGDPPPAGPPGPTPRLWEHEVVELFVASADDSGEPRYTEIELSPWGHHLVLRLEGIRNVVDEALPLRLRTRRGTDRWLAAAWLGRHLLPPPPWRVNAFAVHGPPHDRRYLAATPLPGSRPDFHQPDRFRTVGLVATG